MRHQLFKALSVSFLVFAVPAMAADPALMAGDGTRLDLQARGAVQVAPDLLILRASVVTQAPDAAAAMRENAARMARVQAALRQAGLKDREIRTDAVSLTPQYRYAPNEPPIVTGYQATNSLSLHVRDLARAGSLIDALVGQ
ncbi:MAG: SIMPL domain-containing protein, partial [Chakrabartia sp.]